MALNPKQIAAVMALPGPRRFEHFIKVVADRQQVWGLYDDGWALAGTDDGAAVFPFWPAEEYALACVANECGIEAEVDWFMVSFWLARRDVVLQRLYGQRLYGNDAPRGG